MKKAATAVSALTSMIAKIDNDLPAYDADILDLTIAFEAGSATQDDLDAAIARKNTALARRKAFVDQLDRAQKQDTAAVQAAVQAEKIAAKKAAIKALPEIEKVAGTIEAHIDGLVAAILALDALHMQVQEHAHTAGWTEHSRTYLTDLRSVDAKLADALSRSNLAPRFDFVAINGVQHLDRGQTLVGITKQRCAKLAEQLDRVLP